MRVVSLFLLLSVSSVAAQQATDTTFAVRNPQVAVRGVIEPEVVRPGAEITLAFEFSPGRGMHLYAPGADYRVVAIKVDAQPGLKARNVVYPPSEMYFFAPLEELVPVYQKPFTLKQTLIASAAALKGKQTLPVTGRVEYQACDDKVCFKPASIPFRFELKAKQ